MYPTTEEVYAFYRKNPIVFVVHEWVRGGSDIVCMLIQLSKDPLEPEISSKFLVD